MKGLALLCGVLLLASGCTHVISSDARYAVDPVLEYAEAKARPESHRGKTLLLGGLIVDIKVHREGTDLEVLRYTLDRYGEPLRADEAGGRFLVRSDRFLDPELYRPGLLVTLTGTVLGKEARPLKGIDYVYPLFSLGEVHVWRRTAPSSSYDPFYPWPYYPYPYGYRYPYDPFWYDRFWYPPYRRK